jgi:integrase
MRGVYEKLKGSKDFYIRYTDANGKRHREHVGGRAAAEEALINRRREVREGKFIAPHSIERISVGELAEKMFTHSRDRGSTIDGNRRLLRRVFPLLGKMPAASVTASDINEVLRKVREPMFQDREGKAIGRPTLNGKLSGASMNRFRFLLSGVFTYGIANGFLATNPVAGTKPFNESKPRERFLSDDEEAAVRKEMRERRPDMEAELDLALNTGMRNGEQFFLTWNLVDLDRGILTVPKEGKTGRRYIPINSAARAALETLYEQSAGSRYVCRRCREESKRNGRQERFSKIVARARVLNFTWHDLRHTFASRLVMAGVDLRQVQQFMGHSSIKTTERYAHLSPEHGKAAIEKLCAPAAEAAPAKLPVRIRTAAAGGAR